MKYTIKKGHHFANFTFNRLFPFVGKKQSGSVMFSKECLIEGKIRGHNKLAGISSLKVHTNSGRLAWESDGFKIRIYGYVYKNAVRTEQLITSLDTEKYYKYSVELTGSRWRFGINGLVAYIDGNLGFFKLRCYPFFGGLSTAPVTMSINLTN